MLEKVLTQEQINSVIKIWAFTSGFIFLISAIALFLTPINSLVFLTAVISGIIFIITIIKYPDKNCEIITDYKGGIEQ